MHFVVKLLSPPVPSNFTGPGSHLVDYMSMLNAILFGLSSADAEHILSLHGLVRESLFVFFMSLVWSFYSIQILSL